MDDRRTGEIAFRLVGILLAASGMFFTFEISKAHQLEWFGRRTEAVVLGSEIQCVEGCAWMVRYRFVTTDKPTRELEGEGGADSSIAAGSRVRISYLPWAPEVSDTEQDIRWGVWLSPLALLSGVAMVITGCVMAFGRTKTRHVRRETRCSADMRSRRSPEEGQ